eukprot:TRINITY_DN16794_c0_g1_i1.p1 TRINITY_DN16794_c0_g1~~TRINITY_DN16794_c0_g1_i1.p1  ORF type:complete len:167 (+),score=36.80 TRINITY_DN16794_c0_g1_i1:48-503(+)
MRAWRSLLVAVVSVAAAACGFFAGRATCSCPSGLRASSAEQRSALGGSFDAQFLRATGISAESHFRTCMLGSPPRCGPVVSPDTGVAVTPRAATLTLPRPDAPLSDGLLACVPPKVGTTSFLTVLWSLYARRMPHSPLDAHRLPGAPASAD